MKIKKLPAEARTKFQSGILMTDAVQCVMELVQNSLDAEATGIAVRIDLKNYQIRVIDNGRGIAKDDLEFVGERFMTSKYQAFFDMDVSVPTYGYSGQALSSLQDVSRLLTIETKSEAGGPTFVKVFQNSKALPITEASSERNGTGTTVTVEDFMYSMPVRRNRINEVLDMEEIKNQLQHLAIIHYNVCFTLRNENKGVILVQTPQASSILESVKNIYGKSVANSLTALQYQDSKYEVTGYISVKSQSQNNSLQLIYVNRRIIKKGVIHKFINNLVKEYNRKESLIGHSPTGKIIKTLKISCCSVFIILIKCPRLLCELFTNVRKTTVEFKDWLGVMKCIHKAVRGAFKKILTLNISSSQHDKSNAEEDKEGNKDFGTSLLLNAVRGAPVKRGLDCKRDPKKRKKLKSNTSGKKLKTSSKNDDLRKGIRQVINSENHESINDSFESPIPKKNIKNIKSNCDSSSKKIREVNESFVEFYEWLKTKFESDTNAFRLYNEFLQFKHKTSRTQEISEFKSPVLGGKRKAAGSKKKNLATTTKKVLLTSTVDEEMAVVTRNQLKILPSGQLRVKRGVQFTAETHSGFPETLTLGNVRGENLSFGKCSSQSIFKILEGVPLLSKNQRQAECERVASPLPSSEIQFTNIIKFRNLSESFFQHPDTQVEVPTGKTFDPLASNTWLSHYQDVLSKDAEGRGKENCASRMGAHEIRQRRNDLENLQNLSAVSLDAIAFGNKAKQAVTFRDEEIQVEILKTASPAQKVDAVVQTLQAVPETPSFASSFAFGQEKSTAITEIGNEEEQQIFQCVEENLIHEVPDTDFWNTSEYMKLECVANTGLASDINEISKKWDVICEKNSASVDFICGHKSHSSSKPPNERSTSKETQTIAAIWTDTLTEIGCPSETGSLTVDPDLNKSKTESKELPKTLPIEEIEWDISQHTDPGFCLTERHDVVPKGLSPKCPNPEATKMSTLSPREKYKIKLTIDSAQNDILADIKWQDESTGDCLKPKIPDGIFFDMSRKAGEGVMNYEDPVLSATLSYCAVKVHNLLHSFTFTKDLLAGVEILGQLDKKFIATKVKISAPKKMELISLFDQHAVDERIKLEELINGNMSPDGKFISSCLKPPVECELAESSVRVASEFAGKISSFGLSFEVVNENTLLVTQAPSFLLAKHEKDLKNKKEISLADALRSLIVNILEELIETRGAGSKTPKVLYNAFCLEACHKAIKFNKALSVEKMTEMINKLQNCTLPFQCAHGRPSVIPIIDLEDFKPATEEKENVDLKKFKKFLNERKDDIIQNSETVQ